MTKSSSLVKVLVIALAIPLIGFGVSFFIIKDMDKAVQAQGIPGVMPLCNAVQSGKLGDDASAELISACNEVASISLLGKASIIAGIVGILIPMLYWLASKYAGISRRRIAAVFPIILRFSVVLIAVSVLLQGAILTYAAYIAESYWIERVHLYLIGAIGLGALYGGIKLIGISMSFGRKLKMNVIGKVLKANEAPRLFGFVKKLADKLGANVPDNIIVGLDPTFYVTSSEIAVLGSDKPVIGETLYVSAPLSRLLSQDELAAVVGHELGHFRGDDTVYSMRFAPVYAGLGDALGAVSSQEDEGISVLARLPAIAMLTYMYDVFAANEATISRLREHKADEAGAEAASAMALSTALIKVSLYAGLWDEARKQNVERLNQNKVTNNLSIVFQDTAKYDVEHESLEEIMQSTLDHKIAHPTDSHPPVSARLEAMGVQGSAITKEMLLVSEHPAAELIDHCEQIEQEITVFEHQLMVAYGLVEQNKETEHAEENQLLLATYSLAAAMVGADGRIDPNEITVAEGIGKQLFEDFDSVDFRDYCKNVNQIEDVTKLSKAMAEALNTENKQLIIKYLRAISEADGNVSKEEKALLAQVAEGLGVSLQ